MRKGNKTSIFRIIGQYQSENAVIVIAINVGSVVVGHIIRVDEKTEGIWPFNERIIVVPAEDER